MVPIVFCSSVRFWTSFMVFLPTKAVLKVPSGLYIGFTGGVSSAPVKGVFVKNPCWAVEPDTCDPVISNEDIIENLSETVWVRLLLNVPLLKYELIIEPPVLLYEPEIKKTVLASPPLNERSYWETLPVWLIAFTQSYVGITAGTTPPGKAPLYDAIALVNAALV